MTRLVADQEIVGRLFPRILEVVENEELVDAGCALCSALTLLAYQEGYSLKGLRYMALGSIYQNWRELKRNGSITTKGRNR